jgi:hypothetical protein
MRCWNSWKHRQEGEKVPVAGPGAPRSSDVRLLVHQIARPVGGTRDLEPSGPECKISVHIGMSIVPETRRQLYCSSPSATAKITGFVYGTNSLLHGLVSLNKNSLVLLISPVVQRYEASEFRLERSSAGACA